MVLQEIFPVLDIDEAICAKVLFKVEVEDVPLLNVDDRVNEHPWHIVHLQVDSLTVGLNSRGLGDGREESGLVGLLCSGDHLLVAVPGVSHKDLLNVGLEYLLSILEGELSHVLTEEGVGGDVLSGNEDPTHAFH